MDDCVRIDEVDALVTLLRLVDGERNPRDR